ncbi:uncharacterized protein LOC142338576 isoform X2 [Convolutriloba macropyga]|uniref:uncharacterized protein LOC142338576 isoform X2 n=1 Tax=Convolutriloba macropyga TaxID=536237 RepID=UPI003F524A39
MLLCWNLPRGGKLFEPMARGDMSVVENHFRSAIYAFTKMLRMREKYWLGYYKNTTENEWYTISEKVRVPHEVWRSSYTSRPFEFQNYPCPFSVVPYYGANVPNQNRVCTNYHYRYICERTPIELIRTRKTTKTKEPSQILSTKKIPVTTTTIPVTTAIPVTTIPATTTIPVSTTIPATTTIPTSTTIQPTATIPATAKFPATTTIPSTKKIPATTKTPSTTNIPATEKVPDNFSKTTELQ